MRERRRMGFRHAPTALVAAMVLPLGLVAAPAQAVGLAATGGVSAEGREAPAQAQPVDPKSAAASDWEEPTNSVDKSAKALTRSVGAKERTEIVTVVSDGDGPVTQSQPVKGRKDAKQTIRKAKADEDLLYVGVQQRVTAPETPPLANDTRRGDQWALDKLAAESVWQTERGDGVRIAVLDTGIGRHVDLPADQQGSEDPDGVVVGVNATSDSGDSRNDGNGHGTHVAGSIAALTDNNLGIAGLAPDVQLMAVKVLDSSGSGYDSWIAEGIRAAADAGADVINMSLGGGSAGAMASAVAYAQSKGVVVVAAAGNERTEGSPVSYPAALPDVVGVGATDISNKYGSFSSAGYWVDVAAPGVSILSTTGSGYQSWNGTSMATPHAAAAIGLLIGAGAEDPASALESTALDLGAAGRDDDFGYGLIDPLTALETIDLPPGATAPSPPLNPTAQQPAPGSVDVSWSAPATDGGLPVTRYVVSAVIGSVGVQSCVWSSGPLSCSFSGLEAGTYTFSVKARNAVGESLAAVTEPLDVTGVPDAAGDSFAEATDLSLGVQVEELIGQDGDLDFWRLQVPSAGTLTADLTSLPDDYDLYLFDAGRAEIDRSWNPDTDPETVSASVSAGTYYLDVEGYGGAHSATDPYTLASAFVADEVPLLPGLVPRFDDPVPTSDGFTVNITNYDPKFDWNLSVNAGSLAIGQNGLVVVAGLAPGRSATLTAATTRTGYDSAIAHLVGTAGAAPPAVVPPQPPATSAPQMQRPDRPAVLKLRARSKIIKVSWSGVDDASQYRVKVGKKKATTSRTRVRFRNLAPNTRYRVCVRATNPAGSSAKICKAIRTRP